MNSRYVFLEVTSKVFRMVGCEDCGAIVGNVSVHDSFHDDLEAADKTLRKIRNRVRNLKRPTP